MKRLTHGRAYPVFVPVAIAVIMTVLLYLGMKWFARARLVRTTRDSICRGDLISIATAFDEFGQRTPPAVPRTWKDVQDGGYMHGRTIFRCCQTGKTTDSRQLQYTVVFVEDYRLVTAGVILAYDGGPVHEGGRNVLDGGGFASWHTEEDFQRLMKEQSELLRKLRTHYGLPTNPPDDSHDQKAK